MITLDGTQISFNGAGLFVTDRAWIHPRKTEITYEIIYVVDGEVYIESDGTKFTLKHGDLVILPPHTEHAGYRESSGRTSFYWVHFFAENPLPLVNHSVLTADFHAHHLFRELLHFNNVSKEFVYITEVVLAHILAEISYESKIHTGKNTKLATEIYEWTRINADSKLTVGKIGEVFGYNEEYLSRLIKNTYGITIKKLINSFLINRAKELLSNSNYLVKEISYMLGFDDVSSFINYFKYHEKLSPNKYRSLYSNTHMNNK